MSITPPHLKTGDTIGVMAPSSYVERDNIEAATAFVEACGYKVFVHPQTYEREHQSAGAHKQKASAFHELWNNPEIKAIWMAGGGNRCLHLLEHIDFEKLKETPKIVIGFSDVTALLNALYAHCGITSIHGPVFKNAHMHKESDALLRLFEGGEVQMPLDNVRIINQGTARGPLIGGNLSLFQYLPQTLPGEFWKDSILFLEDWNEDLSRIDRMLLHLKRLSVLEQINGLILGDFSQLSESGRPFGYTLEDIVHEHTNGLNIPIIMNAPFGHGEHLLPFPLGKNATISTKEKTFKTVIN